MSVTRGSSDVLYPRFIRCPTPRLIRCPTPGLIRWVIPRLIRWVISRLIRWVSPGLIRWVSPGLIRWVMSGLIRWVMSGLIRWVPGLYWAVWPEAAWAPGTPASSDLLVILHSSSGKLKGYHLTKLNRSERRREAKGAPPRLGQRSRAQGIVSYTGLHARTVYCGDRHDRCAGSGVPRAGYSPV